MKKYFEKCVQLSIEASSLGEVPIAALIVKEGKIIAESYNLREQMNDVMAHAEILAIKKAASLLNRWILSDCELYVTLKPCSMCESVIRQSRIKKVYFLYDKLNYKKEYSKTEFLFCNMDDLSDKYGKILSDFFVNRRKF